MEKERFKSLFIKTKCLSTINQNWKEEHSEMRAYEIYVKKQWDKISLFLQYCSFSINEFGSKKMLSTIFSKLLKSEIFE